MAYRPYKPIKKENKDYAGTHHGGDTSKYEIPRMKLFGFRSGIAWKMIPALFYYSLVLFLIGYYIIGEIQSFEFTGADVFLTIVKYIFILALCFSPAIFLSDFKYRDKLPLFKSRTLSNNTIGMVIVIIGLVFMIWVYQYSMSDKYKDSADKYYAEKESEQQSREDAYYKSLETKEDKESNTQKENTEKASEEELSSQTEKTSVE